MSRIEYLGFDEVNPAELSRVVNEDALRTHLVDHAYFDEHSMQEWIDGKVATDSERGCRVRVVTVDQRLAGWCGIQPDEEGFELAIVISQGFWGVGLSIFRTMIEWAKELGHDELKLHLLESRREYKALRKMATDVRTTQMLGRHFTTYTISVNNSGQ